jgi:hypothetical protein
MSKKIRILLIFLAVALVLAVIAWKFTFRSAETSVSSEAPAFTLDAAALLQAFENNEDSANSLYLDKIVEVRGRVDAVSADSLGYTVYLKEADAMSGILCSFDREALDTVTVRAGGTVSLKGRCSGYLLDVNLNRCAVVK